MIDIIKINDKMMMKNRGYIINNMIQRVINTLMSGGIIGRLNIK
jgi:hypothetical protein